MKLKVKEDNIEYDMQKAGIFYVSLKWMRGASRYNNGATLYGKKYLFRYLIGSRKELIKNRLRSGM